MKQQYLEIMECALMAYSAEHIKEYFHRTKQDGLKEHGFPRLTANLGILLSYGKRQDLQVIFCEMMDFCCREIPLTNKAGNDFSVKEIILALLELQRIPSMKADVKRWMESLQKINPYECYECIAASPDTRIGNWAAYNAASEYLRQYVGLCGSQSFLENQIGSQMLSLDENGMYRDPNEPMLYDLASRCQFAVLLHFGYKGKYDKEMDEALKKAGLLTLRLQSVTGEIPFGGRSNQFLFNEAYLAAICEFEASRYQKEGNPALAGEFKDAASLAAASVRQYLVPGAEKHVKNRYPQESMYGCESYAYFDKYMISLASFSYLAYLFSDDTIEPQPCPAKTGGFTVTTTEYFHKTVFHYGGYYTEWDMKADPHYDASGLGRIQYRGAPGVICLAEPFAHKPNYTLDIENPGALSITCGRRDSNGRYLTAAESEADYRVLWKNQDGQSAEMMTECTLTDKSVQRLLFRISADGVSLTAEGTDEVCITIPVFCYDGKEEIAFSKTEKSVSIFLNGWECTWITDRKLEDTGLVYANRNGHYRLFVAVGQRAVKAFCSISPI